MRLKAGVLFAPSVRFAKILPRLDEVVEKTTGHEMVITCGRDGVHKVGSKHYVGDAVDIRTRHLSASERAKLAEVLRETFGRGYDVVDEGSHIHLELDPT